MLAALESARNAGGSLLATGLGVVTLLFGLWGVFGELQDALNTIWDVRTRPGRGVLGVIKQRFWSFTMVVGIGFLLLVSLAASAWLAALGKFFSYPDTVRDPCEVEQGQLLGLLSRQR